MDFSPTQITNELLKSKFKDFKNKFKLIRDPIFSYSDLFEIRKKTKILRRRIFIFQLGD